MLVEKTNWMPMIIGVALSLVLGGDLAISSKETSVL